MNCRQTQVEDETSTDFGLVSGERLSQAVAEFETAGGGAAADELTQTQVEDDTSTDFGLVSGERLSQAVAAFESAGGGGGSAGDRIVLLDGETYSPGAARNFDLTAAVEARQLLTFLIDGTADAYAIMLSDDFLALPAQATTPATAAGAYTMSTRNSSNTLPTQNQGNNWLVWREDDDSIYFRDSRGSGGSLTVTATPLGGGAAGQMAEGSNAPNGLVRERVYRAVAGGTSLPADPPDIWNATDAEFEDDFSPYSRDMPTLGGSQKLVVANGYSSLDDQQVRQNGDWSKAFSLTEQFCVAIADNNSYTLDSTVDGLRYVRSLLPDGWGAWKPIEDGTDGWVEILDYQPLYSSFDSLGHTISPSVDCTYFQEIEFEILTHGGITSQGTPLYLGGVSQWRYTRRPGEQWTFFTTLNNVGPNLGTYKLRYYDESGLNGVAAVGTVLDDEVVPRIAGGTNEPPRRFGVAVTLIGTANLANTLRQVVVGPTIPATTYASFKIRMR